MGTCWNDWPEEDRTWPENRHALSAEVEAEAQISDVPAVSLLYTVDGCKEQLQMRPALRSWEMFLSM